MRDGSAVIVCRTSLETDFFIVARRSTEVLVLSALRLDNHVRSPSLGHMHLADACGDV
jgi:hypothetical protein